MSCHREGKDHQLGVGPLVGRGEVVNWDRGRPLGARTKVGVEADLIDDWV